MNGFDCVSWSTQQKTKRDTMTQLRFNEWLALIQSGVASYWMP